MSNPSDRLRKLSPAKRRLLEKRLAERDRLRAMLLRGPQPCDGESFPLSFSQERFWLMEALEPGNPAHHIPGCTRLRGDLDARALACSLNDVIARHASLRTTYHLERDEPRQRIASELQLAIEPLDLTRLPPQERESERLRLLDEAIRLPFDLAQGPLIRLCLIQLDEREWELQSVIHHIAADLFSAQVFARDLAQFYRARVAQRPPALEPLAIQYKDFATWQRACLQDALLGEGLRWWKGQLAGLPTLDLPANGEYGGDYRTRGARLERSLDPALSRALRQLASDANTTLFSVLFAGFDAWLYRVTGQTDIGVGTPVVGRLRSELEQLVGFFSNSIVLRVNLSDAPSFHALVERVTTASLEAQDHQDTPFEAVLEALDPERHLDRAPLFQVMFNYVDLSGTGVELPGVELQYTSAQAGTLFDLTMYARVDSHSVAIEFEYDTHRYSSASVERFLGQVEELLASAVQDPLRPVSQLELMGPSAYDELARLGNGPDARQIPTIPLVPVALMERFAQTPDAISVLFQDSTWTGSDLDRRSSDVAHELRASGVRAGDRVAILCARSAETLAAMIGVWRVGAAYVPLDPSYPAARIQFVLGDSEPCAVLCDAALTAHLDSALDPDGSADSSPPSEPARIILANVSPTSTPADWHPPQPTDAAYVIYTSGSTGKPKGVIVPHGALANFLASMLREPGLSSADVLLAVTTPAFDIAALELFGPLVAGGAVRIAPQSAIDDAAALSRLLDDPRVTVMQATPSTWRLLRTWGWSGRSNRAPLRALCGGEALAPDLAVQLLACCSELWNLYGPTETTIWSTVTRVTDGDITLGRPIRNTQVWVVDENLRRLPIDVPGELVIGGSGVATGYWNRPELTAERFIPDPFSGDPEARLYRTGDRARMRPDGQIVGLGRLDEQVKLFGHRIELGEIEHCLRQHPLVRDAAVALRGTDANAHLAAYVVCSHSSAERAEEQHVEQWRSVWNDTYSTDGDEPAHSDYRGWVDSTTTKPFPAARMRDWVDETVARIRSLAATDGARDSLGRVLEIGCGTGLLLHRLAPHTERYVGIDTAQSTVDRLRRSVALPQVELFTCAADELESLALGAFDVVVINSVAQYFPSGDYLVRVLTSAQSLLSPHGALFLGDIRSLPALELFHLSVALSHSSPDLPAEQVAARVRAGVAREMELCIDPQLFPRLGLNTRILLKRSEHDDELTRFRFDVVMTRSPQEPTHPSIPWTSLGDLRAALEAASDGLLVERVPNPRLEPWLAAARDLAEGASPTAGALRARVEAGTSTGPTVAELYATGEEAGFEVFVDGLAASVGEMRAHFFRPSGQQSFEPQSIAAPPELQELTNHPLARDRDQRRVTEIRGYLSERLPSALVPAHLSVLNALPRTPNGKLDRRALNTLETSNAIVGAEYIAPEGEVEEELAVLWMEVLNQADRAGRHDEFFRSGGNSLLATRLAARIRDAFRVEIPLRSFFEEPTLARLAELIARDTSNPSTPALPHFAGLRSGEAPVLSFAQERLWFLHELDPTSAAYHMPAAVRIIGELDRSALRAAFDLVVDRHEVLRTSYEDRDGMPRPAPCAARPAIAEHAASTHVDLERITRTICRAPFALRSEPPLRAALIQSGPSEHTLVVVLHHIAGDGWTVSLLMRELDTAYSALSTGTTPRFSELPVRYVDYAAWQRRGASTPEFESRLEALRSSMREVPATLELPLDRARAAHRSVCGAVLERELGRGLSDRLRAFALECDVTLHMLLMAGVQALLHRISGQEQFFVGTSVAGRELVEFESLVGCFVNTLAIPADLREDPSFAEHVRRVCSASLFAQGHRDIPFERVVQALDLRRDLARTPLFQVALELLNQPTTAPRLAQLALEPAELPAPTAKFDLTLFVEEAPSLAVRLEYDPSLFDAETIARWWQHLEALLRGALDAPETQVSRLPLQAAGARVSQLRGPSAPAAAPRADAPRSVLRELTHRVHTSPDATALAFGAETLSFRELDRRSDRLAQRLASAGVVSESRVVVLLPRSFEQIVALCATWKVGGAFVPIDRSHPDARVCLLTSDCGARWVIGHRSDSARLGDVDVTWIDPAEELEGGDVGAGDEFTLPASDQLAYVLYTSGSTGKPKGVLIEHGPLANYVDWARRTYDVDAGGGSLLHTAIGFDLTVTSLWPTLIAGAPVFLVDENGGPEALAAAARAHRGLSHIKLTPAHLDVLSQIVDPALYGGWTRNLVVGGEALQPSAVAPWLERAPDTRIINEYGPTETVVGCSFHEVTAADCEATHGRSIPIGRPIDDVVLRVADRHGVAQPVGLPGELWIGGPNVARGYQLSSSEVEADRSGPFAIDDVDGRMYRSGDRARMRADGLLEFLGRFDDQVKVRGHRVTLGEVEAHLVASEGVQAAVAKVVSGRLIGYVVLKPNGELDSVRAQLALMLPVPLVPSALVALPALPLTPHGKVDRTQLPAPTRTALAPASDAELPQSAVEAELARIWSDVLGLESVGIHDDFFSLGGDSILSLRIVAQARQAGLLLATRDIFDHPTVAQLALRSQNSPAVPLDSSPLTGIVPLAPIQRWFFHLALTDPSHWNQALVLDVRPGLDPAHVRCAFEQLLRHHDALRARFRLESGVWTQEFSGDPTFGWQVVPWNGAEAHFIGHADEAQTRLDLSSGPVVHATLFARTDGQPARLLWIAHHLVVDGVSWRILVEDLNTALAEIARGRSAQLPARTHSYLAYSERVAATDSSLAPSDGPEPNWGLEKSAGTALLALGEQRTKELVFRAGDAYRTTVEELLVAAVSSALCAELGWPRLVLDIESHGRDVEDLDLTRTVGWFTTIGTVAVPRPEDPGHAVQCAKEALRASRTQGGDGPSEVLFNYLGRTDVGLRGDALVAPTDANPGRLRAPGSQRTHRFEINARIDGEELHVAWSHSGNPREQMIAERTLTRFETQLGEILTHCTAPGAGRLTPSDVALSGLNAEVLDTLLASLDAGPHSIEDIYPLTPTQQGMFFQSLYAPSSVAYREQLHVTLAGPLDVSALRLAFGMLIERHELFRASVRWKGLEQPLAIIHRQVVPAIEERDWSSLTAREQSARLETLLRDERFAGFDFERPPLLRIQLVALSAERHALLFSFHHLVLDGWSLPIVLRDLLHFYASSCSNAPVVPEATALAPAPSYREFVQWLATRDLVAADAHWSALLSDFDEATPLGVRPEHGPPHAGDREGVSWGEAETTLDPAQTSALVNQAGTLGATLNTLVQAAWTLVLERYSGRSDVLFGATVSGRPPELAGIEHRVGLFINTVPVRARIRRDATFAALIRELQAQALTRAPFEHTPLPRIQAASAIPAGARFFDSLVVFENYPIDRTQAAETGGLTVEAAGGYERTSYPVTVVAVPGESLELRVLYDHAWFNGAAGTRLLAHLKRTVLAIADSTNRSLSEFDLTLPTERQLALVQSRSQDLGAPRELALAHEVLASATDRDPSALAVEHAGDSVTFAELGRRSDAIAGAVRALGDPRDRVVGVLLDRSIDMIAAIYGVLKAGAAYLPLDTNDPVDRACYCLEDSGAIGIVTRSDESHGALELLGDMPRIDVDTISADADSGNFAKSVDPNSLAYVIYTSGSTGRPKGVAIEHRSLAHYIAVARAAYALTPEDRALQFSSLSFDTSAEEVFPTLAAGATLVLRDDAMVASAPAFARRVSELGISVLNFPTAFWHEFVAGLSSDVSDSLASVRLAILGGEQAQSASLQRWREHIGARIRIVNTYGPTEATIVTTMADITGHAADPVPTRVPIGRPIPGARVYLLDEHLRLVPQGVIGELCIAGRGLARGYVREESLTRARFPSNPFAADADSDFDRLYRTGDLAAWNADGSLEYIGRADDQVKVRGFRVELGEVEAALARLPNVSEACARVQPGGELLAFAVGVPGARLDSDALRAQLAQTLPAHARPARVAVLSELPRTRSGKIDRSALRETAPRQRQAVAAPRTDRERGIVEVFEELFERSDLGVEDDFFSLGGNSLLAVRLMTRLAERFGLELPLRDLFDGPTPRQIGETLELLESGTRLEAVRAARAVDLDAESALAADITPPSATLSRAPESILVAGATSFVGAFLVHELLGSTSARILCPVRATTDAEGRELLASHFARLGLRVPENEPRLRVVAADITQPQFALASWQELSVDVDTVVHAGIESNFLAPYSALRASNVRATEELLRFACTGCAKTFHFFSSTAVFASENPPPGLADESTDIDRYRGHSSGYGTSRWVAERLVRSAGERGLSINILRPGRVIGHSATGACDPDDILPRLLRGAAALGLQPPFHGTWTADALPVDALARAAAQCVAERLTGVQHLLADIQVAATDVREALSNQSIELRPCTPTEWLAAFERQASRDTSHPLFTLMPLLTPVLEGRSVPRLAVTDERTRKRFGRSVAQPSAAEVLARHADFLAHSGYLGVDDGE